LLAALNIADIYYWRGQQWVPPAVLQPRPTADSSRQTWFSLKRPAENSNVTAREWYRDWLAVCAWVQISTPANALFLTPREQQTFKWYAGRAEVVNWKDVPQDARGIVEWKRRMNEVYPRTREHHRHDLAAFSDAELVALADQYGVRYVLVDQTRAARPLGLVRLYPLGEVHNASFAVYRVPEASEP
jgi:hypothetical protein